MEFKKYTKKELEQWCEDNFLAEGIDDDIINFCENKEVVLDIESTDDTPGEVKEILTIKTKLHEI